MTIPDVTDERWDWLKSLILHILKRHPNTEVDEEGDAKGVGLSVTNDGLESFMVHGYGLTKPTIHALIDELEAEGKMESVYKSERGRVLYQPGCRPGRRRWGRKMIQKMVSNLPAYSGQQVHVDQDLRERTQ